MQYGSTLERFANISSDDFENEVLSLWKSSEALVTAVVEQVKSEAIPPMTGLGIISCIQAQVFGYEAFHGQPTTSDILAEISPLRSGDRQPAGT